MKVTQNVSYTIELSARDYALILRAIKTVTEAEVLTSLSYVWTIEDIEELTDIEAELL